MKNNIHSRVQIVVYQLLINQWISKKIIKKQKIKKQFWNYSIKKKKKILYILNDSTIDNPSYSLLQNEIEKIENGKALNLEQSKKIYIDNMKLRKKK